MVWLKVQVVDNGVGQGVRGFEETEVVRSIIGGGQQGMLNPILRILLEEMALAFPMPFPSERFEHSIGLGIELTWKLGGQSDEVALNGNRTEHA